MFQNINDRILKELFVEKKVRLGQKQYLMYYNRIWPCEESFVRFLKFKSTQDQIEQAKTIVARMNFSANFSVPQSFFENLIGVEERGDDSTSAKNKGYVGQDHVVHSVNLYIIGIYFFFNLPLFYNRLLEFFRAKRPYRSTFETPIENQTKAFLTAWRQFALCHDIGYVFERADIPALDKKMWNAYNNMDYEILYDLLLKAIARILFAGMIFKRSKCTFDLDNQEIALINSQTWKDLTGTAVTSKELIIEYVQGHFKSYFRLANINSYRGLQQLLPFINTKKLFTIIRDEQMKIVVIHYWNEQKKEENVYYTEDVLFDKVHIENIWRIGCEEFATKGYQCEYYVDPNTIEDLLKEISSQSLAYLPNFIEKYFAHCLTLSPNDQSAENTMFEITRQIKSWIPFEAFMWHEAFDVMNATVIDRENKEIKRSLKESVSKVIDESSLAGEKLGDRIENGISTLKSFLECDALKEDIFKAIILVAHEDPGSQITSSLYDFLQEKVSSLKKRMSEKPNFQVVTDANLYIDENVFAGTKNAGLLHLQEFIKEKANSFNINYDELVSYHGLNEYDHGIVSAKLLACAIEINRDICGQSQKEMFLKSAWPIEKDMTESFVLHKDTWIHEETIFSILLHNIWVKTPKFQDGIQYVQDISVDPFSYFCAFCDNVQLWDRKQLINMAKASPSNRYHAAQPFDIVVEGNIIHIICQTENILQFLESKITGMDKYLRDASYLLKVTVTQSWT